MIQPGVRVPGTHGRKEARAKARASVLVEKLAAGQGTHAEVEAVTRLVAAALLYVGCANPGEGEELSSLAMAACAVGSHAR